MPEKQAGAPGGKEANKEGMLVESMEHYKRNPKCLETILDKPVVYAFKSPDSRRLSSRCEV